ncbi:MAG: hypothetical protein QNJ72_01970 [Pleurocapsa sp. MO_226.B13]|nr:hypothetical protein [Pleurocapsa sp. MO_226.B13]
MFDRDFEFVLKSLCQNYKKYLTKEIRHASRAKDLLQQYYTPPLIKKIQEKFALDFDYFQYDREFESIYKSREKAVLKIN